MFSNKKKELCEIFSLIYIKPFVSSYLAKGFFVHWGEDMNRYELLILKSELAELNARNSESDWAYYYWNSVAEKLKEEALAMNLDEVAL